MKVTPQNLKRLRLKHAVSQFKLSIESGVSRYRISCYESHYSPLEKEELKSITKFFEKEASRNDSDKKI